MNYNERLRNTNQWVDKCNIHWKRLKGELYNDTTFWDDVIHKMDKDDWWAWIDNAPSYKIQYSEHWRKYSKSLEADTKWVEEKLMLGKPVTKQMRTGYNTPAYRLFMNIKDFINDVNGKPTQHRFEDTEETDFERLFDFV